MGYLTQIKEAADYVLQKSGTPPEIGMILGSGLGGLADLASPAVKMPYEDIPHFPVSTVKGHSGTLVTGELSGKKIIALQGRFHYYEGYSLQQVTFPVRVMQMMGVKKIIITNACGGINPKFYPGALMFLTDHINFMGDNPLRGANYDELGPRFPDMNGVYTPALRELGKKCAAELGIETFEGIYTATAGPYYFSRAELGMVRNFGSDAIGMSTVPEAIVARHGGMEVLGISAVTDMAIPEQLTGVSHEEVMEQAGKMKDKFSDLVCEILKRM